MTDTVASRGEARVVRKWNVSALMQLRFMEVAPDVIIRGVYARKDIPEGTLVEVCPMIPIYADERPNARLNAVRSYEYEWKVKEGRRLIVDGALAAGMGGIYNHDPNGNLTNICYYDIFLMEFFATRDIKKGEELTHDYGWGDRVGARLNRVDRFLRPIRGAR